MLINRCFNISQHIAIIRDTNMNPSILQCKNCWKWRYTTFMYYIHRSKCQKCNSLHKIKHYRNMIWCYKANFKTNPLWLKTPKKVPCSQSFKYINCKSNHQADSNLYLFWKHRFNHDWHNKKSQELWEIKVNLICLSVGSNNQ